MPPLDFPNSPTPSQTYTSSGTEWIYDGAKWTGSTGTGSGALPALVVNGSSSNPNATTNTALFTGTGAYGNQTWFPSTSLWVPNGGFWAYNPQPYGAGALAGTAYIAMGTPSGSMPQINGGLTVPGNVASSLSTYAGRDKATLCSIAADQGPQLVLNNVTYDTTHVYPATALTPAQIAAIKPNTIIDTNHTPKMAGLVTAVAANGSSITVSGWYQVAGSYVSGATILSTTPGYVVGDICTVMSSPNAACAQVRVTSVDGSGNITGVAVAYGGSYTNPPVSSQGFQLYGGHGSTSWVTITTTTVTGNSAAGQNPQTVALTGTNPPPFKAYINPSDKTWNRNSIATVGTNWGTDPWTLPWIEGGGVHSATGEEIDAGNYTGVYYPGQDGIISDFPTVRAIEISNPGNAPSSVAVYVSGNWYNAFVTYGQSASETAFGAYDPTNGWMTQITAGGSLNLGGQRGTAPGVINFHNIGSSQIDAQISSTSGSGGTANQGTLTITGAHLHAASNGWIYTGLPGGANSIGFVWNAGAVQSYVDGSLVGPVILQSDMEAAIAPLLARIAALEARA